ncbi:MAG: hypothetical protein PHZ04_02255 [Patescibacteria group bacterium]|nr:hypothetical protein [Patescibacteria group bacterium]MDD5294316.1 hypothetical protein [Patescibacteria group bacterium]MDD5554139.1 hypothetical protein [Patescibacteria group bacterium]
MSILIDSLLLLFLFGVLGAAADFAVRNIKYIASVLKIRLFAFGILLGLVTTLPELSVGINATANGVASLSVGNLLGGIIVIFGLILGASLLLNRQIVTDGKLKVLIPEVAVMFSPILFGLDGSYGLLDGLAMAGLYLGLIFYLYRTNHSFGASHLEMIDKNKITRAVLVSIAGIIFILLASHWIVKITLDLLNYINVSKLVIGVLIFSIGTNLPEITITIMSWRKKTSELSLSHLLSSAFTNVLILGILASIRPITFVIGPAYWALVIFMGLILILFLFFYYSHKKMDRREGLILLSVYILFLIVNFWIIK